MIYDYSGHYQYDRLSVGDKAPDSIGVYYCGYVDNRGMLIAHYVGRAVGFQVSLKSRLFDHLRDDNWSDVSHFGYRICTTQKEAEELESTEIQRLKPKYNEIGK